MSVPLGTRAFPPLSLQSRRPLAAVLDKFARGFDQIVERVRREVVPIDPENEPAVLQVRSCLRQYSKNTT